jgi:hypothetical protein
MVVAEFPVVALRIDGSLRGESFHAEVSEPRVLEALDRFDSLEQGVIGLLTVGSSAILAAGTGIDLAAVREELDRSVERAVSALGTVEDRIARSIGDEDGVLATAMRRMSTEVSAELERSLMAQADPDDRGSFLNRVVTAVQRVDRLFDDTKDEISQELRRIMESQSETIAQAVKLLREMDEGTSNEALTRIERQLTDLTSAVAARQARVEERGLGTGKGLDYEEQVAACLGEIAASGGDRAEHTGRQGGQMRGRTGMAKRGDVTCYVGGLASGEETRVVVEVMCRDAADLTSAKMIPELTEAMGNRGAQAAIAVVPSVNNPVMCGQPIQFLGKSCLAVAWSPDGEMGLLPLQLAYRIARQMALARAARKDAANVSAVREIAAEIGRRLQSLGTAREQAKAIGTSQKILMVTLSEAERDLQGCVARLLAAIGSEVTATVSRQNGMLRS